MGWSGTAEATLGYASYERLSGTDHAYFGPVSPVRLPG